MAESYQISKAQRAKLEFLNQILGAIWRDAVAKVAFETGVPEDEIVTADFDAGVFIAQGGAGQDEDG